MRTLCFHNDYDDTPVDIYNYKHKDNPWYNNHALPLAFFRSF